MSTKTFFAMGCHMQAILEEGDHVFLDPVPGWFEEWESVLSRFRPESELNRINRSRAKTRRVSPVLGAVLGDSLRAARETDGLATPLVLDAVVAAGYDQPFEQMREWRAGGVPDGIPVRNWRDVRWDCKTSRVGLPAGAGLDFGGIAKGWAADKSAARLGRNGPALVDAGGDISASGVRADGSPWPVGVANPFAPGELLNTIALAKGGVATSGRDFRKWIQQGRPRHHIIDPGTGRPADTDVLTATVIAPNARRAEAGAKAALILGSERGIEWLNRHPGLAGMLVLEDRRVVYSRRFAEYVWR
jgi:thiamine biosynthesis lipoprotein